MSAKTLTDLQQHVKSIARDIENAFDVDENGVHLATWVQEHVEYNDGEVPTSFDYLQNVLDIEYVVSGDGEYRGARILVSSGGPDIWIDTRRGMVDGYWWGEIAHASFVDNIGIDEALGELWACR